MVISLKNQLDEIQKLVAAIEDYGAKHDLSARIVHVFTLALDELITNIISYGYDDQGEHRINVRFILQGSELAAELEDDGKPFNPLDRPAPDVDLSIEDREIGGLGIHFVRELMDKVEYRRENDRNILTLRKKTI